MLIFVCLLRSHSNARLRARETVRDDPDARQIVFENVSKFTESSAA